MKTLKDILNEEIRGDYVSVGFDDITNKKLKEYAISLGLQPIENFHSTVVYSPVSLYPPLIKGTSLFEDTAKVVDIKYLGDPDSEWYAVVLEIISPNTLNMHNNYMKNHNYVHNHDDYIQHISLAYAPPKNLDLGGLTLPDFSINITSKTVEYLK